jgi:hypothetical protein
MGSHTVVSTDGEGRRVEEGHPAATAFAGGELATQGDEGAGEQLDKALRSHQLGAIGAQGPCDLLRRVMLEGPVRTPVQRDQEWQPFTQCQRRPARVLTLAHVAQAAVIPGLTGVAAIVNSAEDSNQLVQRGSRACGVESAQHTGASCFFKVQSYPELTLRHARLIVAGLTVTCWMVDRRVRSSWGVASGVACTRLLRVSRTGTSSLAG